MCSIKNLLAYKVYDRLAGTDAFNLREIKRWNTIFFYFSTFYLILAADIALYLYFISFVIINGNLLIYVAQIFSKKLVHHTPLE